MGSGVIRKAKKKHLKPEKSSKDIIEKNNKLYKWGTWIYSGVILLLWNPKLDNNNKYSHKWLLRGPWVSAHEAQK